MKKRSTADDEFVRLFNKLDAFQRAHPELKDALALWMADRETCEAVYPESAEILKREMDKF